jgi:drug/metabolite transporter (DMT)-like permease
LKKLRVPVFFYAMAAMLFWGLSFIWSSILLQYYQPVTIIFARLILSSAFLFSAVFILKAYQSIHTRDIPLLVLSSIFNPFLYFLLENYGLKNTSPAIAAVIISTIPVFSPFTGYIAFREKLRWFNLAGIVLSFSGILIMLLSPSRSLTASPAGVMFLAGAVVAALAYSVTLKRLAGKYTPLTIISWQNLTGILLFLPFFLIFELNAAIRVPLNQSIVSSFLFLAILASSLSYVFYVKSVKILGISKANIFSNLIPVFTAIFSFFILSESFTLQKVLGIAVVISGVVLSEISKPKH